jgi:hypothetical protein
MKNKQKSNIKIKELYHIELISNNDGNYTNLAVILLLEGEIDSIRVKLNKTENGWLIDKIFNFITKEYYYLKSAEEYTELKNQIIRNMKAARLSF